MANGGKPKVSTARETLNSMFLCGGCLHFYLLGSPYQCIEIQCFTKCMTLFPALKYHFVYSFFELKFFSVSQSEIESQLSSTNEVPELAQYTF